MKAATSAAHCQATHLAACWYKDAIIYEVRVRSFFDGNGDGIGDFAGLLQKLGYLQDLGVNALWLLPFYPSPLRDDGYDISDFTAVHPDVGTLEEFRAFLEQAHRRGIRVITELVLNHTSDQHPWFQASRRAAPGDPARSFYVWSDTPEQYAEARIIFNDFEESNWTWDPVARAWFWHRFYAHQPDLNYDNPEVVQAMQRVLDFWLDLGVDGLRLDAIPYLFERDGTSCENLPETHALIRSLRRHVDERYSDRMLLAEANQWPEEAAAYFGRGDECHMAFHFPIMPRLFMALRMEDRFPIVDILEQTPAIPEACQWALFLRNHDELTLEMVTEEERDFMWRTHASDRKARINQGIRRRLMPLLGNSRRRAELMNALLLSLPGTPVLYYGDELGMGDNVYLGDRNGVRTPMQWNSDRNAGFSSANPQALILPVVTDPEYHYQSVNVDVQQANPNSLLWWTKRMIALRKRHPAFGSGSMQMLRPSNPRVLAFVRELGSDSILVVANLSRFVQHAELDLADHRGARPRELIGGARLPPVRAKPYPVTLGPHAFYWFSLLRTPRTTASARPAGRPRTTLPLPWTEMAAEPGRAWFSERLPAFLEQQSWCSEVRADVRRIEVESVLPLAIGYEAVLLLIVLIEPADGLQTRYAIPLAVASKPFADTLLARSPEAVLARLANGKDTDSAVVYDAMADRDFCVAIVRWMQTGAVPAECLAVEHLEPADVWAVDAAALEPRLPRFEHGWTAVEFGSGLVLKFIRRIEPGVQPDEELAAALLSTRGSRCVPKPAASLRLRLPGQSPMTLAMARAALPNFGDAWQYTLGELARFFDSVVGHRAGDDLHAFAAQPLLCTDGPEGIPPLLRALTGTFSTKVEGMAACVATMHAALASAGDDEALRPEPFTELYQRSRYQGIRSMGVRAFHVLEQARSAPLPLMRSQRQLLAGLGFLVGGRVGASRTRVHGDLQLKHLLYTGGEFAVENLSGDPEAPISQRAMKRSPLHDVAAVVVSFHRATFVALRGEGGAALRTADQATLRVWSAAWLRAVVAGFLRSYALSTREHAIVPDDAKQFLDLLYALVFERLATTVVRHASFDRLELEVAADALEQLSAG